MIAAQVVYHDVPAEVSRVTAYAWQPGAPPVPLLISIVRDGTQFTLTLPSSSPIVVMMRRGDEAYLLDGPIAPRDAAGERRIDRVWRYTITGSSGGASSGPLEWLTDAGEVAGDWPACWWNPLPRWECMGVPLDAAGVVIATGVAGIVAGVARPAFMTVLRASVWGRLVIVGDREAGVPPQVRITAATPVTPPRRPRTLRLETATLAEVQLAAVSPGVYWLTGDSSPPDAWVEIRSARSGPQYMALADVAQGSPQLPLRVVLDDRRDIAVTVLSSRGEPAVGAVLAVFRLIDPEPSTPARDGRSPRRVPAVETTAGADGIAEIAGLGEADYEIVAWHPQFGRASLRLSGDATQVTVRLQSPGIARGRVLAGGRPAGGVDVISVPDPLAYMTAVDPIDVKGGDARTAADGRFVVTLAPDGGGELRIGGGSYPAVRVPLPRGALPLVELADIELGQVLTIAVTLDQDPGCDLRATGPIGRSGVQIVAAMRTGPGLFTLTLPEEGSWEFSLLCGRTERPLAPAVVRISARDGSHDVRLTVR